MRTEKQTIWVADDEAATRSFLDNFLSSRGYGVLCLDSGEHVVSRLQPSNAPSLLMLDIRMPRLGGLEVMAELETRGLRVPTIVLSGLDQASTVVKAMRLGALDYLVKPLEESDLELAIEKALDDHEDGAVSDLIDADAGFSSSNKRMAQIRAISDQVAHADVPVLILGESGVGKDVLARYIHHKSGRTGPFVRVNCAALPADLLESELFGHERGSFTGAQRDKPGKFELATGGTILLDEIGEMSPALQAKLLHVLQDGEYCRVGGTRTLSSEARVVSRDQQTNRQTCFKRRISRGSSFQTQRDHGGSAAASRTSGRYHPFVQRLPGKISFEVQESGSTVAGRIAFGFHGPPLAWKYPATGKQCKAISDSSGYTHGSTGAAQGQAGSDSSSQRTSGSLKEQSASAAEGAEKELILRTLNEVNWNRKLAAKRLDICYKSLLNKLHRWEARGQISSPSPERTSNHGPEQSADSGLHF